MMKAQGTLLIVDDNKNILTSLRFLLSNFFERIITIASPQTIPSLISNETIDVILLDMNFTASINSGNEGIFWLNTIKKQSPHIPVILFTAYGDIQQAVNGMKNGAFDFIEKPWDNAKLITTLTNAMKTIPPSKHNSSNMYWGTHKSMLKIKSIVERVATSNANILITGENGTGKEMLAYEIHNLSTRAAQEMVKVDMGTIPDTLFESEMFGYLKGAFTDAKQNRIGRFESAKESTLFLDEIGNLQPLQQAKILTAIQQKSILKIGSNNPTDIDVRLICATNRNLREMVKAGEFREDLLYRINTITIEIPPLRSHPCDIIPLANIFKERYASIYRNASIGEFDESAKKALTAYQWRGNIRELQHTIEKTVIMCQHGNISEHDLNLPSDTPLQITGTSQTLEEMEIKMIEKTLKECNNNLSLVATKLGITRQTLYNKMKRYEL